MTRLQLKPAKADAGLALVHDDLRQRLSTGSGLGSAELLIDHEIGNGLMVTTRTGQAAADRLKALLDELPAAIAARRATFAGRSRMCWSGDLREPIDLQAYISATATTAGHAVLAIRNRGTARRRTRRRYRPGHRPRRAVQDLTLLGQPSGEAAARIRR